jgi:hypothetical protein
MRSFEPMSPMTPLLVALAAISLSAHSIVGQPVELHFKYASAQELRYESITTTSSTLPFGEAGVTTTTLFTNSVTDVDASGNARIRRMVQHFELRLFDDSQEPEVYDSRAPMPAPGTPFPAMMTALGRSIDFVQDSKGVVLEPTEFTNTLESVLAVMGSEIRTALEVVGAEAGVQGLVGTSLSGAVSLPQQPIAIGDSWEIDTRQILPVINTVNQRLAYTLSAISEEDGRRIARFDITGRIGPVVGDATNPLASMVFLRGAAITGLMRFDLDRGLLLEHVVETSTILGIDADFGSGVTGIPVRSRIELRLIQ